jgi:hypothetical protein
MSLFSDLQDNLIKRISHDGTFKRLKSLRILYVFIELNLDYVFFISNSNLRNNRLEEIEDDAFEGADSLNEL